MAKIVLGLLGLSCLLLAQPARSDDATSGFADIAKSGLEKLRDAQTKFRVCASPANLPYTDKAGEGFDDKIAQLVAGKEGKPLTYARAEPGRGFIRATLEAWDCDVIMSVPAGYDRLATSKPYYCSKYVELRRVGASGEPQRIGVMVSTPPLDILLRRNANPQVYLPKDPESPDYYGRMGSDLVAGRVDAAWVWGPLAAKFVYDAQGQLEITSTDVAALEPNIKTAFSMAMGVRHGDEARLERLNALISSNVDEIKGILESYGVPLVEGPQCAPPKREASLADPSHQGPSGQIVKVADAPAAEPKIKCDHPESLDEVHKLKETSPEVPYEAEDGKLGPTAYLGWLTFAVNCERCHGPGGVGSAIAPDLAVAIKGLTKYQFDTILHCGLRGNLGIGVMPSWAKDPDIISHVDNLYAYLKARADGKVGPGRPEKLASKH